MSGHSHWAKIKRKKAVVDSRRGKNFATLIRGVEVAARDASTSNPENNIALAAAVERAKAASMPADTITKAAKRGAGELDEGVVYERVLYEGYAPGGAAILVEALTENRNRTGQEIRALFARRGVSLGEPGSVAWMFERKGCFIVANDSSSDDVLTAAADAGASDVSKDGDDWQIVCEMSDFGEVRKSIEASILKLESAELTMLPITTVQIEPEPAQKVIGMLEALDDLDDVQNVYTNFEISERPNTADKS